MNEERRTIDGHLPHVWEWTLESQPQDFCQYSYDSTQEAGYTMMLVLGQENFPRIELRISGS